MDIDLDEICKDPGTFARRVKNSPDTTFVLKLRETFGADEWEEVELIVRERDVGDCPDRDKKDSDDDLSR